MEKEKEKKQTQTLEETLEVSSPKTQAGEESLPSPMEGEDELLKSPKSTGTLDDAIEQLSSLRVKKPNLTTAQRREAIKARLLKRGEVFDPAKWRRGKKKR